MVPVRVASPAGREAQTLAASCLDRLRCAPRAYCSKYPSGYMD